jgi:hypothetical protein
MSIVSSSKVTGSTTTNDMCGIELMPRFQRSDSTARDPGAIEYVKALGSQRQRREM